MEGPSTADRGIGLRAWINSWSPHDGRRELTPEMCLHTQYDAFARKINPQTWGSTCRGPVETGQACLARLRCGPSALE